MTSVYLPASRGRQQDHGRVARVRGIDMHRVSMAALMAAVVSAAGVGLGPAQSVEMRPGTVRAAVPERAATASATPQQATGVLLRRLPPLSNGSRLSGEEASLLAPVYVTRKQADAKARFRLGTLSSVSVLPESGTVTVSLNGVNIKALPVGAAYGLRVSEFDVPEGLLRQGWNSVGIAAHHRHRVDCSVDATEELWTRVDPAETGLMFADGTAGFSDPADIAAIGPRPDGVVPIGIVLDGQRLLKPEAVERIGRAVQGIALAGRFAQSVVEFENSSEDGLDLVVGTVADIAGKVDRATLEKLDGPAIIVVPGVSNRRPLVVVTGRSDAELDVAIAKLGIVAPIGTVPGLNALAGANGHQISADGQSLTFSDLGLEKQELMGHTLRIGFSAALPRDFLAADYGRVAIDLAGGYAAGLGADAQIIVEVNGRSAGSVLLSSANGENFLHKRHFLPLSAFRPGQNRIELRVNAPDGAAVGCDTSANAAPHARVWLNATSRIVFPSLARVGRVPDLAMTSSGAFPFAGTDGNMTLVVPTPDRATLGAALTVVARLGVAAGRQIPFSFATNQAVEKPGHVLVVAPARALDPAGMQQVQLDPDLIRQAWSAPAELSPAALSPVSRAALRRRAYEGDWPNSCATDQRGAEGPQTPRDQPNETLAEITGAVRTGAGSAGIGHLIDALRNLTGTEAEPDTRASSLSLLSSAALLVAQGPREGDPDSVVTIISSPNAATLKSSIACLVEPKVWSRLSGRLSILDASTGAVAGREPETRRYVATQEFSIDNQRLMIAGWLSLNPRIFIFVAFLLAFPLAVTTHFLVRNVGRKNQ
jgi:cellulose synthase operon protein B